MLAKGPGRLVQAMPSLDSVCAAMLDYSRAIAAAVPSKTMALREFQYRNGWFLASMPLGSKARALHEQWLQRAGVGAELINECGASDLFD